MKRKTVVSALFLSGFALVMISHKPKANELIQPIDSPTVDAGVAGSTMELPAINAVAKYKVDVNKSKVIWRGYYVFLFDEHNGSIQLKKGQLNFEKDVLKGGSFEIDMHSMQNMDLEGEGKTDLINHLKSDDFFSVSKYPGSAFTITRVEKAEGPAAGKTDYTITGDLTLKGITRSISFPAVVSVDKEHVSANAKLKIDRTLWNIKYNSGRFFQDIGDGAISDGIGIELELVGTK